MSRHELDDLLGADWHDDCFLPVSAPCPSHSVCPQLKKEEAVEEKENEEEEKERGINIIVHKTPGPLPLSVCMPLHPSSA